MSKFEFVDELPPRTHGRGRKHRELLEEFAQAVLDDPENRWAKWPVDGVKLGSLQATATDIRKDRDKIFTDHDAQVREGVLYVRGIR